jgi:sec-independent protein translocase protein TatA
MGNLGFSELLVILIIVLLVFGGGKLPGIGDALGRSIRNFKKAATGDDEAPAPPPPAAKTPTNTPSA